MDDREKEAMKFVRLKQSCTTAEVMGALGIDVVEASEVLKSLEATGHIELVNRAPSVMGRNEYVMVRITGKGIRALDGKPEDAKGREVNVQNIGSVVGNVIQAPHSNVAVSTQDSFKALYGEIDRRADISDYEKEDLRRKISELEDAIAKKDRKRFDNVSRWVGKFAPWLAQVLTRPEIQDAIKRAFGL